jgi:hypothetical protein
MGGTIREGLTQRTLRYASDPEPTVAIFVAIMFVLLAGLLVASFDIGCELAKNSLKPGSRSKKFINEAFFK